MRVALVLFVTLPLGTGLALAQSAPAPTAPPAKTAPAKASAIPDTPADNMAECMRMWDAATHMSKQEWARTCRRIQTRLENLTNDKGMPKLGRKKKADG